MAPRTLAETHSDMKTVTNMTIKIKESVKFKNLIEYKFILKPNQIFIFRYCIN